MLVLWGWGLKLLLGGGGANVKGMAGFQFFHIEGYARTAAKGKAGGHSISSVMAEAMRVDGACPHVEQPLAPVLLFGSPPSEVEAAAKEWGDTAKDAIGRKLRKDGLCLLAGVVSCPPQFNDAQWQALKLDTVAYLAADGRLVSCIEHVDEAQRHIHFYKIPPPGGRFEDVHPGKKAAMEAKAEGGLKGDQNRAYKAAMRGLQDDFFEKVGVKHGLARLGPARRRLTREGWAAEQAVIEALAKERARLEAGQLDLVSRLEALEAERTKARSIAKQMLEDADKIQAEREKNKAALELIKGKEEEAFKALELSKKAAQKNRKKAAEMATEKDAILKDLRRLEAGKKAGGVVGFFVGQLGKMATLPVAMLMEFVQVKKAEKTLKKANDKTRFLVGELRQKKDEIETSEQEKTRAKRALELAIVRHKKELQTAGEKVANLEAELTALRAVLGPQVSPVKRPRA
jgi:hypothetical protein